MWECEDYFTELKASGDDEKVDKGTSKKLDVKQRLQQSQKRGRDSDKRLEQIKEQVRKPLDGGKAVNIATSTSSNSSDIESARATYDYELMIRLEHSP